MKTVIEMAREAHIVPYIVGLANSEYIGRLERFAELVRADERNSWPAEMEAMERQVNILTDALAQEREAIMDEWSMCVQSDLEHGVKSLNEQAAKDWFKNYPEIAKFGVWLEARSNT